MRIYLAGLYETAISQVHNNPGHQNFPAVGDLVYPAILESYHYIQKGRTPEVIRDRGETIFLDSGAFSMFTKGIDVDLEAYAAFIEKNKDIIHVASNLDHIGRGGEAASYENQKGLESYGAVISPVHHARDDDSWLKKYLDEGYDYIFLGGMVPESTQYLRQWLDRVWGTILTHGDGTPRVKVHGFGLTTEELMLRYPWYSVDSTSWVMTAAMGTLYMDLPHKNVKVSVSRISPKTKQAGQHFSTLTKMEQRVMLDRFEELGFKYDDLADWYAWRWRWNIEFFRRQMASMDVPRFINQTKGLFD